MNIQGIADSYLCSNCGACKTICPKDAIRFNTTSIGRMYATVDSDCVDCSLCCKVCPSIHPPFAEESEDKYVGKVLAVYVGKTTNKRYYLNSQSGGACTAIISYLFDRHLIDCAVLCKMDFGNPPKVKSILVTDKKQLYTIQKSCYTPVELLGILRETKVYKSIAVVGLPCHIQGLTALMMYSKEYNKKINYKIGLICDRTLCGTIQDVMMSYVKKGDYKIDWRRKNFTYNGVYYPYNSAPVVIYSSGGVTKIMPNSYRFALKDMFTAPRCRLCFDKLNITADIVVGDPWGMQNIDWNEGASLIITRNERGDELMHNMRDDVVMELESRDINDVINGQQIAIRKKQISIYSKAAQNLAHTIESYLLAQDEKNEIDDLKVRNAEVEFEKFVSNERKNKEEIISLARDIVRKNERKIKLQHNILYRILRKFKKIVIK